jgi:alkanesulfonate monooxygenase SsuD/methylene tetrahydromethanopterin reductase-like flavin-dependent oxidoreductase (luciferase family)
MVGWCKEEFEAIGTEPFGKRGAVNDETIAVCRELWTNENPSFAGKPRGTFAPTASVASGRWFPGISDFWMHY